MEEFPGQIPESNPIDSEKKKKRKKRGSARVPGLVSLETDEKQKSSKADKSEVTDEKPKDAADKPELEEEPKADQEATTTDAYAEASAEQGETSPEELPAEPDEAYEALESPELEPVEFSGGEVIIHLSGDTPVEERVIPLRPTPQVFPTEKLVETHDPIVPIEAVSSVPVATHAYENPFQDFEREVVTVQEVTPQAVVQEQVATKKDVEEAVYYATKAGERRGVIAGGILAGSYEHFKHKRRERRHAKRFDAQSKELETTRQSFALAQQELAQKQASLERQAVQRPEAATPVTHEVGPQTSRTVAQEQQSKTTEPATVTPVEQPTLPPEHRLETSAWHSIEVDAKTGRAVENPTFQYGHEYYRERAQENVPAEQRNAAAGEVALVAAAQSSTAVHDPGQADPVAIPSATHQGPPPSSVDPQDSGKKKLSLAKKPTASSPLWPWLVTLVAVIFALIAVLR